MLTDEWFGRARAELRGLLDFVVCINVPLDIALARLVLRASGAYRDDGQFRGRVERVMDLFLHGGVREAMRRGYALAVADCELVVDGAESPDRLAEKVVSAVHAHQRHSGAP